MSENKKEKPETQEVAPEPKDSVKFTSYVSYEN